MIARLRGKPVARSAEGLVLDVGGGPGVVTAPGGEIAYRVVPLRGGTADELQVAVEELLTNVMTHAYGNAPGHQADVGLRLLPEEIWIRLEDAGAPFNPFEAPAPDLEALWAERLDP